MRSPVTAPTPPTASATPGWIQETAPTNPGLSAPSKPLTGYQPSPLPSGFWLPLPPQAAPSTSVASTKLWDDIDCRRPLRIFPAYDATGQQLQLIFERVLA